MSLIILNFDNIGIKDAFTPDADSQHALGVFTPGGFMLGGFSWVTGKHYSDFRVVLFNITIIGFYRD